jgi:hypothetical protein
MLVIDEKHKAAGRAGVVSAVLAGGEKGTLFLDATAELPAEEVAVTAAQCRFLGR